jgi:glycosyltransferase involved in cell wall biosynthesis
MIPRPKRSKHLVKQIHYTNLYTNKEERAAMFQRLMRFCFGYASRAIVLSSSFRGKFAGLVEPDRVRVVYNGIPPALYEACKDRHRSRGSSAPLGSAPLSVLYLGGLFESKGFFDLLRSVPDVLKQTTDVRFVFVGDKSFPEARQAIEWVQQNSLERYVSFLGTRSGDEKTRIFQESDVFAFPTWYPLEGQPVAVIEAMAAGLPVLTTRHATIPDILGEDGAVYVNKRDPEDIAEKLLRLLGDESLRRSMGQINQNRFLQCHTADKFAEGVARVLRQALCVQSPAVDCLEGL